MWSLNGDHIAGTTFLYKIIPSVNLQKSIKSISNVYYVIKTTNSCSICLWRTHSLFFFIWISDESGGQLMCSPQTDQTLICSCYNINIDFIFFFIVAECREDWRYYWWCTRQRFTLNLNLIYQTRVGTRLHTWTYNILWVL